MTENNDLIVKKHSAMIQTSVGNLTLTQRKAINFLICIAQKSGRREIYKTTISNIKEICNLASTDNIVIRSQLKALTKTTIEFNYLDKDKQNVWEISALLAGCKILPGSGMVEFAFSPFLLDRILHPEMYAPINIILIAGLKCSYSVILYEFLRDYLTATVVPMITIEKFRSLLGINDNEYRFFSDFKKKVLTPATEEINLKTDICCRYELIKETGIRNKYSHIRFFVSKKTGNLTYEKNEGPQNEESDFNMDLFEKEMPDNQPGIIIPENILIVIPDDQRTEAVKELIAQFLEKGHEYVISNIKYAIKNATENFGAYLKLALENDYAKHDREVSSKIKAAATKKRRQVEEKEKIQQAKYNEHAEIQKKVKALVLNDLVALQKKVEEMAQKSGIKPEFLTDAVRESLMVDAYKALHPVDAYSAPDRD